MAVYIVAQPQKWMSCGGEPQMLYQSDQPTTPSDWTKDGQNLILTVSSKETGADVFRLPLTGARTPVPLVQTKFQEGQASVSPDGGRILSNEEIVATRHFRPNVVIHPPRSQDSVHLSGAKASGDADHDGDSK